MMRIRANVKGGYMSQQHNEKLADDSSGSIKRKKNLGKKLLLSKETIRELKNSEMRIIAGGALNGRDTQKINTCI